MRENEIKEYIKAKYQEVDGYIDMIINHNSNDINKENRIFTEYLGIRTALNLLNKYIEFNGEIDFLETFIEGEFKKLYE